MTRLRWLGLALVAQGCAPSPAPQTPPAAAATASTEPATAPAGPATALAKSAGSTAPAASGWASYEVPKKKRQKLADPFADCVAVLRTGEGLGEGVASDAYSEALEQEGNHNLEGARRGYFRLIQEQPQSPYIPLAYLAFGELFASEALADASKWSLAQEAYKKVAEYPPTINPAHAYALLRLGEVLVKTDDPTQSLEQSRRAVLDSSLAGQLCGPEIRQKALQQTIEAYAMLGRGGQASHFFRPLAANNEELAQLLEALVARYKSFGRYPDACQITRSSLGAALRQSLSEECGKH